MLPPDAKMRNSGWTVLSIGVMLLAGIICRWKNQSQTTSGQDHVTTLVHQPVTHQSTVPPMNLRFSSHSIEGGAHFARPAFHTRAGSSSLLCHMYPLICKECSTDCISDRSAAETPPPSYAEAVDDVIIV